MKNHCLFSLLSKDCKILIFSFFNRADLESAIIVCWDWKNLITNENHMFKLMCQRLWKINIPDSKVVNWKLEFKSIGKKFIFVYFFSM